MTAEVRVEVTLQRMVGLAFRAPHKNRKSMTKGSAPSAGAESPPPAAQPKAGVEVLAGLLASVAAAAGKPPLPEVVGAGAGCKASGPAVPAAAPWKPLPHIMGVGAAFFTALESAPCTCMISTLERRCSRMP